MTAISISSSRETAKDAFLRHMASENEVLRLAALQGLGGLDGDDVKAALLTALRDPDEDVRIDAAAALARFAGADTVDALLFNLREDPCAEVKQACVQSLGKLKAPEVVDILRRLVRGRDDSLTWDDEAMFTDGWDYWVDIQIDAIRILGDMEVAEAADDILAAMQDEFGQDLSAVGPAALARMGAAGFAALRSLIGTAPQRLRLRCIDTLADCTVPEARDTLSALAGDDDLDTRLAALSALGRVEPGHGAILRARRSDHPAERLLAFRLLPPTGSEFIEALLEDPAPEIRLFLLERISAAGGMADEDVPDDVLAQILAYHARHAEGAVASASLALLARIDAAQAEERIAEILNADGSAAAERMAAVKALGDVSANFALRHLARLVRDDDRGVCLEAVATIAALARRDNAEAYRMLIDMTGGRLPGFREGDMAPPADETPSGEPGGQPEETRQSIAAAGLDSQAGGQSTLGAILGDERQALEAVETADQAPHLSHQDMEMLARSAQAMPGRRRRDPDGAGVDLRVEARALAARLLGDHARADAALVLAHTLDSAPLEVRRATADSLTRIAEGLGGLPDDCLGPLGIAMASKDVDLRRLAVRGLALAAPRGRWTRLKGRLKDPNATVRREACLMLAGDPEAQAALHKLIADPSPVVRQAAAEAIAQGQRDGALEPLMAFTFTDAGAQKDKGAELLRQVDPQGATGWLCAVLEDPDCRRQWGLALSVMAQVNGLQAA